VILIVDPRAEWYAEQLAASADGARLDWAPDFERAAPYLRDARAVITMGIPQMGLALSSDVIARMPKLEWVQCLLAGYDHLIGALQQRPEITLTTASGIHGPQMAETVLLHMLVLARTVKRVVVNQLAHEWQPWPQPMLDGRVVVIVGLGASGTHLARVCAGLGMTVVGVSRTQRELEGVDRVVGRDRLSEVAALADFLVVCAAAEADCPLIDASVIAALPPSAFLVNVGRGSLVDELALIDALRAGRIAGAGLDVFAREPLAPDSPLWDLDNVFVTPHVAGRSDRYAEQTLAVVEPNLRAFLGGRSAAMINVVAR
jgi:D-2-hydroxyacid dehydrogenase (NADP+)